MPTLIKSAAVLIVGGIAGYCLRELAVLIRDVRAHQYVKCSICGAAWMRLDFHGGLHARSCQIGVELPLRPKEG